MELTGERLIAAPIATVWAGLNDPEVLKACINGCESLERTGDDAFAALVAVRVGPVSAKFKGTLKTSDVKPPTSYTIAFDGQGGVAGFGKGSADVRLAPEGGGTRLSYQARAQVGGKMAQVGSRLIDAAAAKIAEDFFSAFEARLAPPPPAAEPSAAAPQAAPAPAAGGGNTLWWIAGALVLAVLAWLLMR
ncbi:SRPBCC family protein [Piscinibacter sp.]|uniref:SRPBCC family protein n=1 Tax=Piscinibacter sp. TaxID=1903157 RepID=UPI0039E306D9